MRARAGEILNRWPGCRQSPAGANHETTVLTCGGIDRAADDLIDALASESLLELAWEEHGFRGPLGTIGKARNALLQSRLIERIDAVGIAQLTELAGELFSAGGLSVARRKTDSHNANRHACRGRAASLAVLSPNRTFNPRREFGYIG